jgi:hypothetical protein
VCLHPQDDAETIVHVYAVIGFVGEGFAITHSYHSAKLICAAHESLFWSHSAHASFVSVIIHRWLVLTVVCN